MPSTSTKAPTFGHNKDGTLDEIFAEATFVHVEQMSDQDWWIGITLPSGELLHVNFWTPRTRIRANYNEEAGPWGGEFSSGVKFPEHDRATRR